MGSEKILTDKQIIELSESSITLVRLAKTSDLNIVKLNCEAFFNISDREIENSKDFKQTFLLNIILSLKKVIKELEAKEVQDG